MSTAHYGRVYPAVMSLLLALILEIVPLPNWAVPYRPDWLALCVIYWTMMNPRRIGIGASWVAGLALDTHAGSTR